MAEPAGKPATPHLLESVVLQFRRAILEWYRKNRRVLPWREDPSPYRVWLSEVMLQQTRVETVVPYFERFVRRFPDVRALAEADLEDVLKVWEGLGYYSRIRNLHRAAREVVARFGGKIPGNYGSLLSLPGIGPYTAGAIASIAFNQPEPVVDGNVIRVLARVFDLDADPSTGAGKTLFWQLARRLLSQDRPGDFNQAVMELGATVCKPRNYLCEECPLRDICLAYRNGTQPVRPLRKKRQPVPHFTIGAGLVWKGDRILIARRPEEGLLGGLWEFPGGKKEPGETLEECVRRELREELGVEVEVGQEFARVRHAYTHFRITLHVYHCRYLGGEPRCNACTDFRWVRPQELEHFPFPRANKLIVERLLNLQTDNQAD